MNCGTMNWSILFDEIKKKDYAIELHKFLNDEYKNYIVYPPRELLFNAFKLTPLDEVKVVIIGQDPYPNEHQAMGLAFATPVGITVPPSLKNIYKEIENEFNTSMYKGDGDLTYLAKQGVLLLNAYLSVRAKSPLSHKNKYYEMFFEDVLMFLDQIDKPIVFMLWGNFARYYKKYIHNPLHLVLEASHPSPLAMAHSTFFGSNHFVLANKFLESHQIAPINWIKPSLK